MNTKELSEVIAGGGRNFGNTQRLIEQLKKIHKGSEVVLICHSEDEEKNLEVLKEAGLEVVCIKHEEDYRLLPKYKSIVILNTEGVDIENNTELIKNAISESVETHTLEPPAQQKIDEWEKLIKQKEYETYVSSKAVEDKEYQREQMKQRSRYLSKNCRK